MDKSAERRTLGAASLLVRYEVQRILGLSPLPPRVRRFLDDEIRTRVMGALDQIVEELAEEIRAMPESPQRLPPITQRLSVLTNDIPCGICSATTGVAVHDIKQGELVQVECERCAPEFHT